MFLERLPLISAFTLALAISAVMSWQAYLFWQDYQQPRHGSKPAIELNRASTPTRATPERNISSFKLFGDPSQKPIIQKPVVKDLPKTKLNLTLTGVMTSDSQETASALIQGPDRETVYYRVNDELPGGAILKQVHADRVVVERSGSLENLEFIESRPLGIEKFEDYRDKEAEEAAKVVKTERPARSDKTRTNPARTQGIKERLSKLRQKMLKNRPSP